MKQTNRAILTIAVITMLMLGAGCVDSGTDTGKQTAGGASGAGKAATGSWTGDAKDFAFTTFAGMSGKASDFAGKPLVVNFWAAW